VDSPADARRRGLLRMLYECRALTFRRAAPTIALSGRYVKTKKSCARRTFQLR
jgi:hypothetical protein